MPDISGAAWRRARNILCVRLDTIGDVLMTTPAIRALKESAPKRRITLLTSSRARDIAPLITEVDEVIVYDAPWMKATTGYSDSRREFEMAERLRSFQFDAAVIFTVYTQSPLPAAYLCFFAGIPLRLAHCRENPYSLLTDWLPETEPDKQVRHEVRRQLDLVSAVGASTADERLSLTVPESAYGSALAQLKGFGVDRSRPWAVLHPGASAPSRRYPPEGFAAAAQILSAEYDWQIILTGDRDERELTESVRSLISAPVASFAGLLTLAELAAVIAHAPLLISNNTAPVHLAAAVGTPVVDLYALTNPQHTPWAVPHRVLSHDVPCKYCYKSVCPLGHHDCLRGISPADIVAAALELAHGDADDSEPDPGGASYGRRPHGAQPAS